MAAGLAQLRELERLNGWKRLEELGARLEEKVRGTIGRLDRKLTFHRVGSMFCLFFAEGPIGNLADAQRSDRRAFAGFFHGCLERGVYLAPSQFETGFISLSHTEEDLEETARVMDVALAETR